MMMCLEIKTPAVVSLAHDCCKPALDAVYIVLLTVVTQNDDQLCAYLLAANSQRLQGSCVLL